MTKKNENKSVKCKYHHINHNIKKGKLKVNHICTRSGWDDENIQTILPAECESCPYFESKFIEYPLTITAIEDKTVKPYNSSYEVGSFCKIKPCNEEYEGKTYLGVYLGELPIGIYTTWDKKTGVLSNSMRYNPAIFVPELNKIIYGCESWWGIIDKLKDFKEISKEEIDNVWYVQMFKELSGEK